MFTQSNMAKALWVGVSLWLILAPSQQVWGQQEATTDATPATATPALTNEAEDHSSRVFLPFIVTNENANTSEEGTEGDEENTEVTAASSQVWYAEPCVGGPQIGQFGLWDDIPGAGLYNDSGLLWFNQTRVGDETCFQYTNVPGGVLTSSFSQLRINVALGDGGRLFVRLYRYSGTTCSTSNLLAEYPITNDNNQFTLHTLGPLPGGHSVCRVQLRLTDYPDSSAAARTSALIDYIQIRHPTSGAIGWQETFSNQN